jgi:putative endonuclease
MYYVYIIKSQVNKLYIGSTNDLKRRMAEHNSGKSFSTRGSQWILVYYESYRNEKDARVRERRIKQQGQAMAQLKRRIKNSLVTD